MGCGGFRGVGGGVAGYSFVLVVNTKEKMVAAVANSVGRSVQTMGMSTSTGSKSVNMLMRMTEKVR